MVKQTPPKWKNLSCLPNEAVPALSNKYTWQFVKSKTWYNYKVLNQWNITQTCVSGKIFEQYYMKNLKPQIKETTQDKPQTHRSLNLPTSPSSLPLWNTQWSCSIWATSLPKFNDNNVANMYKAREKEEFKQCGQSCLSFHSICSSLSWS